MTANVSSPKDPRTADPQSFGSQSSDTGSSDTESLDTESLDTQLQGSRLSVSQQSAAQQASPQDASTLSTSTSSTLTFSTLTSPSSTATPLSTPQPSSAQQSSSTSQPTSALSLADIERQRSHPLQWVIFLVLILVGIIMPYWVGRLVAVRETDAVISALNRFTPAGIVLIAWTVMLVMITGFVFCVIESRNWWWRTVFLLGLVAEQFIAGVCMLKTNFWYSTFVLYGASSGLANAANLGILAAGLAAAAFTIVFVGLLVAIRRDSPLNVLIRGWASFAMFFLFELIALVIVLFGGLLTTF